MCIRDRCLFTFIQQFYVLTLASLTVPLFNVYFLLRHVTKMELTSIKMLYGSNFVSNFKRINTQTFNKLKLVNAYADKTLSCAHVLSGRSVLDDQAGHELSHKPVRRLISNKFKSPAYHEIWCTI